MSDFFYLAFNNPYKSFMHIKRYLPICCLLLTAGIPFALRAQQAEQILLQALEKSRRVQNGYYEMLHREKFMTEPDTVQRRVRCYFRKMPQDTLVKWYFHNRTESTDGKGNVYQFEQLYNGKELAYTCDSVIVVAAADKWAQEIKNYVEGYDFFKLLLNPEKSVIARNLEKRKAPAEWKGTVRIGGIPCRHVSIRIEETPNPKETVSILRSDFDFWISETDSTPVQYDITYKLLMGPDTVWQYDRYLLTHYRWNHLPTGDSLFALARMPADLKITDYVPYKRPELLKVGETAPLWQLPSLNDEVVKIDDFKGQLVLLDFFYKSCYPCMQALPVLQQLHEKYRDKGLKIIGVNPFDTKAEGIADFLSKRNITYTVVLDENRQVVKSYRVSAYPTMYLIDRQGKIVWTDEGFGEESAQTIEETILKHL